jgi:hypothetical protein
MAVSSVARKCADWSWGVEGRVGTGERINPFVHQPGDLFASVVVTIPGWIVTTKVFGERRQAWGRRSGLGSLGEHVATKERQVRAIKKPSEKSEGFFDSAGRIRTYDLQVMSLASCLCSTARPCFSTGVGPFESLTSGDTLYHRSSRASSRKRKKSCSACSGPSRGRRLLSRARRFACGKEPPEIGPTDGHALQ